MKQAEATLNQRDVDVAEFIIRSPITGQVTTRVAALGENFSAGAPLFSMIDMNNLWFTFNLREDLLGGLKIGDKFDVIVPALKSPDHSGSRHHDQRAGAIRCVARDARHRRFRSAHF